MVSVAMQYFDISNPMLHLHQEITFDFESVIVIQYLPIFTLVVHGKYKITEHFLWSLDTVSALW